MTQVRTWSDSAAHFCLCSQKHYAPTEWIFQKTEHRVVLVSWQPGKEGPFFERTPRRVAY
ncbi:MAG: hypothetical protein DME24_13645 [Verrucomicrobia bacterium]|nr:MAG: hypothetical protein DME24_13645 [Verrucomicrobiota bacterium]